MIYCNRYKPGDYTSSSKCDTVESFMMAACIERPLLYKDHLKNCSYKMLLLLSIKLLAAKSDRLVLLYLCTGKMENKYLSEIIVEQLSGYAKKLNLLSFTALKLQIRGTSADRI